MIRRALLILQFCTVFIHLYSQEIKRVEPPSWWIGMENRSLQLMIYGENISAYRLSINNSKIVIGKHHKGDSPNYIFVDIEINPLLKPGDYTFYLSDGDRRVEFSYTFEEKRHNRSINTFGPEDALYLIMPDRFANSQLENDNHPDAAELFSRDKPYGRHGGDIRGIIDNLDYIASIGMTAIWSTPLLFDNEPVSSYHGYACSDYYRIDPRFGTNELYREMVLLAAERGIKIIKDMVPNHCGVSHWWMEDLPFKDWIHQFPKFTRSNYAMTTHSDIHSSKYDRDMLVKGWFDNSMPDMNLTNPYVLRYFTQNAIWWVEWASLSGIRVDTFPYSDKWAASMWVKSIIDEYPSINIVGECWYPTAQEVAYWEGGNNNRDGYNSNLSSVMDFPLHDAIQKAFKEDSIPGWGEGLFRIYRSLSYDKIYRDPFKLMIFADNHDTHRMAEFMDKSPQKVKMALTLLATMRGIPQLYYGTEIMLHSEDGRLGHGEERIDMPGGWPGDNRSVFKKESLRDFEYDVLDHFSKVFNWRKSSKAIHKGKMTHYWPTDNLYIFFRIYYENIVMVVINNNTIDESINWDRFAESIKSGTRGVDIISGKSVTSGETISIPSQSSMIIDFTTKSK
ncbi:MAG: glycoside hydrolase family 13 protein [Bacteroidales bacterium]|jgi:glycosidase|nr:glycoside hydrolase family 13 protein [Bacteroidales bacterium]